MPLPEYPCGWPADDHTPLPGDSPSEGCGADARTWTAVPASDHLAALMGDPLDVCEDHAQTATEAGWIVTSTAGESWQPARAPGRPAEPETVQARAARGEPDAVRRMEIYNQLTGPEPTDRWDGTSRRAKRPRPEAIQATADLGDGRGPRPVTIRRATPEETAAFEEFITVAEIRRLPGPPANDRPTWRAGDEPRGLVQPVVAYSVLGVAVGLALAGELYDTWRTRRDLRRVARELRRLTEVRR